MDDEAILNLYCQRSSSALAETEAKYGRLCFSIANNILQSREDAEECVNDTWLHAWNAMQRNAEGMNFPWCWKSWQNVSPEVLTLSGRPNFGNSLRRSITFSPV